VLLVISWHQGGVTSVQASGVLVPAALLGLFSTVAAVAVTVLLNEGAVGATLIIGFAAATAVLYRGYLTLRRRHQSLAVMHEFVEQGVGASTVEELAETLLFRTRRLLNADEVELTVYLDDADLRLRIGADGTFRTGRSEPARSADWLLTRVGENAEPIVIPRHTRERGMRQWLIARGARDAMIVPLPGPIAGVLIVKDRLGEASTFTPDDLTLLQTLAGHIVVALRGTQLVQQLRHDATHDALTGLPNRMLLTERLEQALGEEPDQLDAVCGPSVLLLDLDRFTEVNDALGHHVGDALLDEFMHHRE
jgi:predicted signal transduction protein with EAL and GGDEF domain